MSSNPYCNLCGEPKVIIATGIYVCDHCDRTKCQYKPCAACALAHATRYPEINYSLTWEALDER